MEQQADWQQAFVGHGLEHVRFGVWNKLGSTPQFTGDRPGTACEAIEIVHPMGKKHWNGGGSFGFWSEPIVKAHTGERVHPTQKPLALMRELIALFTDPGDLVLDPFAGSFTTGVACKELGRRFIGIELEQKWVDVGVKRLRNTEYKPPLWDYAAWAGEQPRLDAVARPGTEGRTK